MNEEKMTASQALAYIGKELLGLVLSIATTFLLAAVIVSYWRWFVAIPFSLPVPQVLIVWGLLQLSRLVFRRHTSYVEIEARKRLKASLLLESVGNLIAVLLVWGVGAIVHLFV